MGKKGLLNLILDMVSSERKKTKNDRQRFYIEAQSLMRVVDSSLEIIKKTKNLNTAISRFDVIKQKMAKIIEISHLLHGKEFELSFGGKPIKTLSDLAIIDETKREFIKDFQKNKGTSKPKRKSPSQRLKELQKEREKCAKKQLMESAKQEREGIIKGVEILCAPDNQTCDICKQYDRKKFKVKDAPKIPLCSDCRCTYVPWLDV